MTGEPDHLGGHVVLTGDDGLGVRVLEELCELGVPITAVCERPEAPFARAARAVGVRLVVGVTDQEDTLREAGVGDASACGLLADADLTNLHTALELQELAPRATVVMRLFNYSLAGAIRGLVGDVTVLSATEIAAPAFVAAILGRRAVAVIPISTEALQIVDLTAERPADVRTLEHGCQARVLAVGATAFPTPDSLIVPGDELRLVGTNQGLAELERHVAPSALAVANGRGEQTR